MTELCEAQDDAFSAVLGARRGVDRNRLLSSRPDIAGRELNRLGRWLDAGHPEMVADALCEALALDPERAYDNQAVIRLSYPLSAWAVQDHQERRDHVLRQLLQAVRQAPLDDRETGLFDARLLHTLSDELLRALTPLEHGPSALSQVRQSADLTALDVLAELVHERLRQLSPTRQLEELIGVSELRELREHAQKRAQPCELSLWDRDALVSALADAWLHAQGSEGEFHFDAQWRSYFIYDAILNRL